jgi:hypothetical protein
MRTRHKEALKLLVLRRMCKYLKKWRLLMTKQAEFNDEFLGL